MNSSTILAHSGTSFDFDGLIACLGLGSGASDLASSILDAATKHLRLRDRLEHPVGELDSAGRFHLTDKCECCSSVNSPSWDYPYSHMIHGRSIVHVATAAGLADYARAVRAVVGVIDREGVEAIPAYLVSQSFLRLLEACAVAGLDLEAA